jgi:regulator of PEP synthase PpsR (kinase-PPPase family)
MPDRTVFFVSDGTGITAETFGNSILAQFSTRPRHVRRPFIDRSTRPQWCWRRSTTWPHTKASGRSCSSRWSTTRCGISTSESCKGLVLDMFRTFVEPLEDEFGVKSNHRIGRFLDAARARSTNDRIEAINFSLAHDDGQSARNLAKRRRDPGRRQPQRQDADLAVPGDAARHQGGQLPADPRRLRARPAAVALAMHKRKCFGLTIDPERLAQIRHERRPAAATRRSRTAATRCSEAETMMRRAGIAWLSSTHKSIEEIATTILRDIRPDRLIY